MKTYEEKIQTIANSFARKHHFFKATTILFGNIKEPKIIDWTPCGYRKCSNHQYVPKAYLRNFGWKNTYYQHALTTVVLPFSIINWNKI